MPREEIYGEKLDTKSNFNPFRNKQTRCNIKQSVYRGTDFLLLLTMYFQ